MKSLKIFLLSFLSLSYGMIYSVDDPDATFEFGYNCLTHHHRSDFEWKKRDFLFPDTASRLESNFTARQLRMMYPILIRLDEFTDLNNSDDLIGYVLKIEGKAGSGFFADFDLMLKDDADRNQVNLIFRPIVQQCKNHGIKEISVTKLNTQRDVIGLNFYR